MSTLTIYRAISLQELEMIEASGFTRFPPRLPDQPVLCLSLQFAHAEQLARDWIARFCVPPAGFVTQCDVVLEFLKNYRTEPVEGTAFREYQIPSDDVLRFNNSIVGQIEIAAEFYGEFHEEDTIE